MALKLAQPLRSGKVADLPALFAGDHPAQLTVVLQEGLPGRPAEWAPLAVRALERGQLARRHWVELPARALEQLRLQGERPDQLVVESVQAGEVLLSDEAPEHLPRPLWVAAARVHTTAGAAAHLVLAPSREQLEAALGRAPYAEWMDFDLTPAQRAALEQQFREKCTAARPAQAFAKAERDGRRGGVEFVDAEADEAERLRQERLDASAQRAQRGAEWARPGGGRREQLRRAAEQTQLGTETAAAFHGFAGGNRRSRTGQIRDQESRRAYQEVADMRRTDDEFGRANDGNIRAWQASRMAANAQPHTPSALRRAMAARGKPH